MVQQQQNLRNGPWSSSDRLANSEVGRTTGKSMGKSHQWNDIDLDTSINIHIWANYNDLTATSLETWLIRGIIPKWPYFRFNHFVKYHKDFGRSIRSCHAV
jgi:hypothetical protein